jgi:hypothetical protein
VQFIGGQTIFIYFSSMLARFSSLPHGLELLEGNIHDHDTPPSGELAMLRLKGMLIFLISPLDPKPPWGTLTEFQASTNHYIHQAWHNLLSPST